MLRCPGCDAPLDADAAFCTNCGLPTGGGKAADGDSKNAAGGQTHPQGTPQELGTIGVGRVVDGKYRVDRVLGEGGMGVVYAARSLHTDVDVVIKAVRPEFAHRKDIRDRTLAEGRALARIDHPNVVQLKTVVLERDELLLVMQYIEGESLEEVILRGVRERRPMRWDDAIRIFYQVLDGVGAAHAEGVIHRDLKPANILIRNKDGVVKVTDFGIAKPVGQDERKTDTKGIIGSVHYMAPEQVKGLKDLDLRCDVYALGILLFQMLTGRVPFDADNTYDVLRKQVEDPLPSLLALRPDVPPAVEGIVQRACAKERAHRFGSCAQFKQALEGIPSGYAATTAAPIYQPAGKTVPEEPVFDGYGPAPAQTGTITGQSAALPPTRRDAPGRGWLIPVIGVVGLASAGTLLIATGVVTLGGDAPDPGETTSGAPLTTASETHSQTESQTESAGDPLAAVAGEWASDTGRLLRAVVVGNKIEFQVVDASQFAGQGYRDDEPRFVLHPLPEPNQFLVEDRIRPLPPTGTPYDIAQAHPTCMAVWRDAGGDPLRASLTGDRLDVDFAKIEPTARNYVIAGGKVISCRGLEALEAKRLPQVLRRP